MVSTNVFETYINLLDVALAPEEEENENMMFIHHKGRRNTTKDRTGRVQKLHELQTT